MRPRLLTLFLQITSLFVASSAFAENRLSIVVSIPEQRLYVFNPSGEEITKYKISTSKFGIGNSSGSYSTPLGRFEVASKIGSGAVIGTVFKNCSRTGEIVAVNARGRDPIVTRILCLRGLEAQNASAFGRRIYIHGTPDEAHLGQKVSYGCIRMRSSDIIALYETVESGASVEIVNERVGSSFAKARRQPIPLPMVASAPAPAKTKPKTAEATTASTGTASSGTVAAAKYLGSTGMGESTGKSKALSLSEPLIGEPETPKSTPKKKSVASTTGGKGRS